MSEKNDGRKEVMMAGKDDARRFKTADQLKTVDEIR
jgi:hypothetical protein